MLPRACVLLLAVALVGCLEPRPVDDAPGVRALDGDAVVAYHVSVTNERRSNFTAFLLRADGTADRLVFLDDGSAAVRYAPGVEYPYDDLRLLFDVQTGNANRSAGGLVLLVERGRVPEPEAAALLALVRAPWPTASAAPDDFAEHDYARLRADGGADLVRAPPLDAAFAPVAAAFRAAEEAFVVERTSRPHVRDDGPRVAPCATVALSARSPVLVHGETLALEATVESCEEETLVLGAPFCDDAPALHVEVSTGGGPGRGIPASASGAAAFALDFRCHGGSSLLEVPPGGRATATRVWNGTFADCDAGGRCSFAPAPPGRYHIVSYLPYQSTEMTPVEVVVLDRDTPRVPLLVVEERAYVNASGEGSIVGDFGPHCAPVHLTTDPWTATVGYYESRPPTPAGLVVRDWRAGGVPERAATVGGRLAVLALSAGAAALSSPFDASVALGTVRVDGDAFLVDDDRLAPGEARTWRVEHVVQRNGVEFRTTSVLTATNVGDAAFLAEARGACY